ncbi:hypothetical protein FQN60_017163 [Etheostoma spectabile]|uniref:Uncharacterized protein n=1 Tax=Etheostoma spectabile TaxID=54343 RepID=A0A5J5DEP0_9PERO|nr:hypothetical protein FQN60_017163 [Etheostoma spectabile]
MAAMAVVAAVKFQPWHGQISCYGVVIAFVDGYGFCEEAFEEKLCHFTVLRDASVNTPCPGAEFGRKQPPVPLRQSEGCGSVSKARYSGKHMMRNRGRKLHAQSGRGKMDCSGDTPLGNSLLSFLAHSSTAAMPIRLMSHANLGLSPTAIFANGEASLFEVNIRYVGGLLSAYYLTGEEPSTLNDEHASSKCNCICHSGWCKAAPLPSVKACGDHGQLPAWREGGSSRQRKRKTCVHMLISKRKGEKESEGH